MKGPALGCQRTQDKVPGTWSWGCKRKVWGGGASEAGGLARAPPSSLSGGREVGMQSPGKAMKGSPPLNGSLGPNSNSRATECYSLKGRAESEDTEAHGGGGGGTCPRSHSKGSGKTRTAVTSWS